MFDLLPVTRQARKAGSGGIFLTTLPLLTYDRGELLGAWI